VTFLQNNSDAVKAAEYATLLHTFQARADDDAAAKAVARARGRPSSGGLVPGGALTGRRAGGYSLGDMKTLALNAGFQGADADKMAAIAMVESSGNPNAHNTKGEDSY